jgi:hypothetical protein
MKCPKCGGLGYLQLVGYDLVVRCECHRGLTRAWRAVTRWARITRRAAALVWMDLTKPT